MINKKIIIILSVFVLIVCIFSVAKYDIENNAKICLTYRERVNNNWDQSNITKCFIGAKNLLSFRKELKENKSNWYENVEVIT